MLTVKPVIQMEFAFDQEKSHFIFHFKQICSYLVATISFLNSKFKKGGREGGERKKGREEGQGKTLHMVKFWGLRYVERHLERGGKSEHRTLSLSQINFRNERLWKQIC